MLELIDTDIPKPSADEVLVRMASISVSKPDFLMRTGRYPWTRGILPFSPGVDGTGIIVEAGSDVKDLVPGTPVYVEHPIVCGCYAEYKCVPVSRVTVLPEGIDLVSAGAMLNHIIAWGMLTEVCTGTEGNCLYIPGAAGGMGTAVVQLAPKLGFRVIASASTEEKCGYLKQIGADCVFNHAVADPVEEILSFTEGNGADVILDQLVGEKFRRNFEMLADYGLVVIYNHLHGFPSDNIVELLTDNFAKCHGIRVFSAHVHDHHLERFSKIKEDVFGMLRSGIVTPHIGGRFRLEEVQSAHALLDSGNFYGRIILTP